MIMTGAARAQAPGQAPQPTLAPLSGSPSVMDRRFSLSAGIGWQPMETKIEPGAEVVLGILELAGRFRIARRFEVGGVLVLGGADGLQSGGLYLEGRYRFRAERPWNIYMGFALGVASAAAPDATEAEKKGRGAMRLTLFGLERRWERFAIFGDVDLVSIAKNEDLAMPSPPPIAWQFSRYGLGGAAVTFGGTLYF